MATPFDNARPRRTSKSHPELIEVARMSIPVILTTEEAQRILKRRFESYQHSVYFLFFVAREYMSAKRLDLIEQSFKSHLDITMDFIKEDIEEANAWANERQTYPQLKEHVPQLSVEVKVCTSLSRRYLEVIEWLDEALWRLHAIARIDLKDRSKWKRRAEYLIRCVRNIDVDTRREIEKLKRNAPDHADHSLD